MRKIKKYGIFNKIAGIGLSVMMALSGVSGLALGTVSAMTDVAAASGNYELIDHVQDSSILHCWNWSYNTIEEHLELIAQCGYSAVQTSPCTQPKDYMYEGVVGTDVGTPGAGGSGNWWKAYQPVTESVCDNGMTWYGTKEDLKSLCEAADGYGIKVIVDVVANHMGNITGWKNSLTDVSPQIGEYWNPDMLTDESFWHINSSQTWMSDGRYDFTQGTLGMPDLNTADSRVQKYIKDYLLELVDCGVDGFRFDAAKHIETPDDDPEFASDFWPNVLNPAKSAYKSKTGDDLYVYGEILNTVGDNFSINSYTKYMSVTDNSAGNHLLDGFRNNNIGTLEMNYDPNLSVLWAESHDTYMNEASRYASDKSIVRTWAMVANKDNAAGLFFVRPYLSSETLVNNQDGNFKSNLSETLTQAQMGECPTYVWASKEVAAVNHFNNRFANYADNMGSDGRVAYVQRGQGIILVNFDGPGSVSVSSHGLADGSYTDEVSGNTFTVSGGKISGKITSEYGIAVVYKNVMANPGESRPVQISSSLSNGSKFYTNGVELTITAKNATSASYKASTGETGSFTDSTTVTIGKGLSDGQTVTLTVTGKSSFGTITKTYTYTRDSHSVEISADKEDGSKFYTDGMNLTINALYADTASYKVSTGESGTFTGSKTITIGEGLNDGDEVTVTVTGTSAKGTVTKTFTYIRKEIEGSNLIYFKNTSGWSEVYAYAWNAKVTPSVENGKWPGVKMECVDSKEGIYSIELDVDKNYNKVIFNNNSSQTEDLTIPGYGYIYDGKWTEYNVLTDKPVITTTLQSSEVSGEVKVTYTVKDATSATYSLNGSSEVSFDKSITLTVGKNSTDTVVIKASNSVGTATKTYTYTRKTTQSGWHKEGTKWYYYVNGNKVTGWKKIDRAWYYFNTSGIMQTSKWIEGKYYVKADGKMATSEIVDNGKYYVNADGLWVKATGWKKINGSWYYFNSASEIQKSKWISGKYYVKADGKMATSEIVDNGRYYVDADGLWVKTTGWQKVNGKWYYLSSGTVQTSKWVKSSGKWYYVNETGVMETSKWISGKYYVKADGSMAVSEWVDNGRYFVGSDGVWVKNAK